MNDINKALDLITLIAQTLLENGAEVYRVEETVIRACKGLGFTKIEIIALPTGVYFTLEQNGNRESAVKRIKKRNINLSKVEATNRISRKVADGLLCCDEAIKELQKVNDISYNSIILMIATALSSGFFSILLGGKNNELTASLCSGFAVSIFTNFAYAGNPNYFVVSIFGGFIATMAALIFKILMPSADVDIIIICTMLPLLPGISMINAVRDTIAGDTISGISRAAEALITALALAAGAYVAFFIYSKAGFTI